VGEVRRNKLLFGRSRLQVNCQVVGWLAGWLAWSSLFALPQATTTTRGSGAGGGTALGGPPFLFPRTLTPSKEFD